MSEIYRCYYSRGQFVKGCPCITNDAVAMETLCQQSIIYKNFLRKTGDCIIDGHLFTHKENDIIIIKEKIDSFDSTYSKLLEDIKEHLKDCPSAIVCRHMTG